MKNKGFTLLELLIVVVILGILSLIASAYLFDAADKAKDSVVKANINAASSTVLTQMTVEDKTANNAIEDSLLSLNDPDGVADSGDEVVSPYDTDLEAFLEGDTGDVGQVALSASGELTVIMRGYGKNGASDDPIGVKTISTPESE
ncbi:MAG: prepilin-type N-terminal cleavage/methylation domain-containing protein [Cyanobacteriota bacterium]